MAYPSMGEAHRRITEYLNKFSDAVSFQDGSSLKLLFSLSSNSSFLLSPMLSISSRVLAERADRELASSGKAPEKLKAAGSFLMKVFGVLAGKGPKRVGALYVTCQLFKIYFKLGTVHLCRSVIRSIETARIFDFEEFPARDKVTFMYYTGRLDVYNEKFPACANNVTYVLKLLIYPSEITVYFYLSEFLPALMSFDSLLLMNSAFYTFLADHKLSYALMHCNPQNEENIRMILKYLIPVKLSIGNLPRGWLLERHNLTEYTGIVEALKSGDLRLLRNAFQEHEHWYIPHVLKIRCLPCPREAGASSLPTNSKKNHFMLPCNFMIQKQKDPSKAHQIKLEVILKALKWLDMDMDVDEVECIMAILIYRNLMKGYFAHKSKVVVLSKQDPFPKLNGKPVNS
ncbi:hypothetical protein RJ641_026774 [Dillenia turbinata]|uniref:PCI domain-containing protein n=1 Tax=Dillenia turbinata TaxID=194707 RepID=A0AAN8W8X8_9MAGN